MGEKQSERRQHVRFPVPGAIALCRDGGLSSRYVVRDLSVGGAFLAGGVAFDRGHQVEILLKFPDRPGLYLAGYVVRREVTDEEPGIGIVFFEWPSELERLVDETEAAGYAGDDFS